MKITAEFNSNEELLSFISTFGTKVVPEQSKGFNHIEGAKTTVSTTKEKTAEPKEETTKPPVEKAEDAPPKEEVKEDKVTLEMVRAVFQKLVKSGKQKDAKDITAKYGASKLPELKEEHFAAVLKEAEALL